MTHLRLGALIIRNGLGAFSTGRECQVRSPAYVAVGFVVDRSFKKHGVIRWSQQAMTIVAILDAWDDYAAGLMRVASSNSPLRMMTSGSSYWCDHRACCERMDCVHSKRPVSTPGECSQLFSGVNIHLWLTRHSPECAGSVDLLPRALWIVHLWIA